MCSLGDVTYIVAAHLCLSLYGPIDFNTGDHVVKLYKLKLCNVYIIKHSFIEFNKKSLHSGFIYHICLF